jgi:hypothetical protein
LRLCSEDRLGIRAALDALDADSHSCRQGIAAQHELIATRRQQHMFRGAEAQQRQRRLKLKGLRDEGEQVEAAKGAQ